MSQQSPSEPEANQKFGCVALVIAAFFVAVLVGQCNSSSSHRPPLTTDEQRASQIFQDRLGADPGDADRAAQQLNEMLERDRRRAR